MDILNINEHLNCFNYDHSTSPQIELIQHEKGKEIALLALSNEIVFFLEGSISYSLNNTPVRVVGAKKMLFLPMGYECSCLVNSDVQLLVFRLHSPIKLCESFFIEHLFDANMPLTAMDDWQKPLKILDINTRISMLIKGLLACLADGIKCRHYFDLKIREFFMLLRAYYPKSELREFLCMILSSDTAFSEYVRKNRNAYPTVIALAQSMHLTQKQFARRFGKIFGRTPYEWMKEGKILSIHSKVTATKKPFKQVAIESGFNSTAQLTKFCKKELGKTPGELRSTKLLQEGKN